jgi:radical SAM superfamily enzyme YgiQ (UPF0313 family)
VCAGGGFVVSASLARRATVPGDDTRADADVRIALVALSGVRTESPELAALGMSLPGFAPRAQAIAAMPSLGLLTLAGMTPPDRFDVTYHEVDGLDGLEELPDCDLAAVSALTARAKDAYRLAARFRERGTRTVVGGLHATVLPEEAERHFDSVVVGEGELTWPALLRDAERGTLARRYAPRRGEQFDLRHAPRPRLDLADPDRYDRLPVQTARGCPWRCDFCASSILLAQRYRVKPVAKVLEEVRAIKRLRHRPFVELADDNTFVRKRHSRELMRALAEEGGVRWFTETDVAVADDEELLALMRQAGCVQVLIGLESPTGPPLAGVELRRDWKRRRLDSYRDAIERIQAHGIAVNGCFVLGLDGGSRADAEAIAAFVVESGLHEVQITVATPFPGTPLYARLALEGRLLDPTAWERCTLFDVNFRPRAMSVAELERSLVELAGRLYSGEAKAARAARFRLARRASRRPVASGC